ncbi:MAG: CvpA family protein [Gammaproteobacteria bacterium]|nr:CvpA family protein [Gammaproteobacteria bacterium]
MQWFDVIILSIIGISAIISLIRGFVKEAMSLAGWVAAIWVSLTYSDVLAGLLAQYMSTPSIRFIVAFTSLFVVTLLLSALINFLVSQLVKKTGLSGTDRMIGVIFGVARGAAVVGILVLLAGLTPLPQDDWWQDSKLVGHFQQMATWASGQLPPEAIANLTYDKSHL